MKNPYATGLLMITASLLAGCHEAPVASPDMVRPLVERQLVKTETNSQGTVLIPVEAQVQLAGTPGVFVLTQNKRARFRMIKTGKRHAQMIAVSSGLLGNETLVMGPYDNVYDGSLVRPAQNKKGETL